MVLFGFAEGTRVEGKKIPYRQDLSNRPLVLSEYSRRNNSNLIPQSTCWEGKPRGSKLHGVDATWVVPLCGSFAVFW